MNNLEKNISSYLREIKKSLPCSFNTKYAFISMLKSRINDFLQENSGATFDDIIAHFGTAEAIVNEFDVNEYSSEFKRRKMIIRFLEIIVVLLIAVCIITGIALYESQDDGYTIIDTDSYIE